MIVTQIRAYTVRELLLELDRIESGAEAPRLSPDVWAAVERIADKIPGRSLNADAVRRMVRDRAAAWDDPVNRVMGMSVVSFSKRV